jgi:hypothetical protein
VPREALAAFHAARYRPRRRLPGGGGRLRPRRAARTRWTPRRSRGWTGEAARLPLPAPPPAPPAGRAVVVRPPTPRSRRSASGARGWTAARRSGSRRGWPTTCWAAPPSPAGWAPTCARRRGGRTAPAPPSTRGSAGGWIADTAVDVEVTADAVAEIVARRGGWRRAGGGGRAARAKDALILSLPRVFETRRGSPSRFVTVEAFGLPDDYWERYPARWRRSRRTTCSGSRARASIRSAWYASWWGDVDGVEGVDAGSHALRPGRRTGARGHPRASAVPRWRLRTGCRRARRARPRHRPPRVRTPRRAACCVVAGLGLEP